MGNITGVDQSLPSPRVLSPAMDITLAAGVETLFLTTTTPVKSPTPGDLYMVVSGVVTITFTATVPTALQIAARYHSGTDLATQVLNPLAFVLSTTAIIPVFLIWASSDTDWYPTGKIVELTGLGVTHDSTLTQIGSYLNFQLFRGPTA